MVRTPETGTRSAVSLDGRRFEFDLPVAALDVRVGTYVVVGGDRLGQVTGLRIDPADRSLVLAEGRLLERLGERLGEAAVRPAEADEVARWLEEHRPDRAALRVGELQLPGVPLDLDAGGFDRHSFLCGQSGSGKTYALGTILERLLLQTSLRIVVLDPNSDFVRLGEPRPGTEPGVRDAYAEAARDVEVRSALGTGADRLHVRFRDFDRDEQAAVFRLDPIADRDEYGALTEALETRRRTGRPPDPEIVDGLYESPEPFRSLGLRARNLGIDAWRIWSGADEEALGDLMAPGGPRCVVVDLGSLETREEQAIAAEAALAALWRRRTAASRS